VRAIFFLPACLPTALAAAGSEDYGFPLTNTLAATIIGVYFYTHPVNFVDKFYVSAA